MSEPSQQQRNYQYSSLPAPGPIRPQPWPSEVPRLPGQLNLWGPPGRAASPGGGAVSLDPATAARSRKLRTWIGVVAIIVGVLDLFGTAVLAAFAASHQTSLFTADSGAAIVLFGAIQGAAYIGIGIWSLVTRGGLSRGPLVSVLVLTSIGLVLGLIDVVTSLASGQMPMMASYVLIVFLFSRAIVTLRLKPASDANSRNSGA